jgi:hypothetical protein
MAIQFLLVTFPEQRSVLADGAAVGVANHILMLPADEYQISLDGGGYAPASQDIALDGTSMVRPLVIAFTPTVLAPADATPGTTRGGTASTRGAPPAAAPSGVPAAASKTEKKAKTRRAAKTPAKKPGARTSGSGTKKKPHA